MDELSRDLMRGVGGLDALNGGLDGNLSQWAEGEAIRQTADQPDYRRSNVPRSTSSGTAVAVLVLAGVVLILLLLAAL